MFVILTALAFFLSCEPGPTEPTPDKFINVDVMYVRQNGSNTCLLLYPDNPNKSVYLLGLTGMSKEMTKIADGVCQVRIDKVRVNYPDGVFYDIYTIDNAFVPQPDGSWECACRARGLAFNGVPVPDDKIRTREGGKEYVLVRFEENGVPHYY